MPQVIELDTVPFQRLFTPVVALSNTINFGDLHLNESRSILFSITNHHAKDSVRFEWPDHAHCTFSPRLGHLHAGNLT